MKNSLIASAVLSFSAIGVYLLVTYPPPVATPGSSAVARTMPSAKELFLEEVSLRKNEDADEIFRRAFWREPSPDDRIHHAERREWVSLEKGVRRWQWFLAFEPSAAFSAWLRGDNAFSLTRVDAAQFRLAGAAPAWFPSGLLLETCEIQQTPDHGLTIIFDSKTRLLYATDAGHGFAVSAVPQVSTQPVAPGPAGASMLNQPPPPLRANPPEKVRLPPSSFPPLASIPRE